VQLTIDNPDIFISRTAIGSNGKITIESANVLTPNRKRFLFYTNAHDALPIYGLKFKLLDSDNTDS
jgi:hypothetical protein